MKVKALRGVCIGVNRHMKAGDIEDLEPAMVTFLVGIGAVEPVKEQPKKAAPEPVPPPAKTDESPSKSAPDKSGSKEK